MAKIFRAVREIVQDMCDDHKAITGVELTPDMLDNTIVIKFYDDAGALSLLYSAVQQVANDSQPATASKEARIEHLRTRQMSTQIPAQKSHGQITFTVTKAVSIPANSTQVKRLSDGAIFVAIQAGSATGAGQVTLYFESADSGNDKNLDSSNQPFTLITPIDGVNPACTNASLFLDGRDLETSDEMLERIQAHDRDALGGGQVLITRARRGDSGPTIASRFLLRLEAMTGGVTRAPRLMRWADAIDRPAGYAPADRPSPTPPADARPKKIAVTSVDRLKADPFAFYARSILRLSPLDPVDANPGPAWRGQQVHALLDAWFKEDGADPSTLRARAEALLAGGAAHPLTRALWLPRLIEAIDWIAAEMTENFAQGRRPIAAEIKGEIEVAGVRLNGTADRIDRFANGGLAIVDYKTGSPPANTAVAAGYAMQLGLLGLIASRGGFADIAGEPASFEYWSLAKKGGAFGYVARPADDKARGAIPIADFPARAAQVFAEAAGKWLTGDAPFTAKLHPEYAPYGEYDQLMRLDEWYGREDAPGGSAPPLP